MEAQGNILYKVRAFFDGCLNLRHLGSLGSPWAVGAGRMGGPRVAILQGMHALSRNTLPWVGLLAFIAGLSLFPKSGWGAMPCDLPNGRIDWSAPDSTLQTSHDLIAPLGGCTAVLVWGSELPVSAGAADCPKAEDGGDLSRCERIPLGTELQAELGLRPIAFFDRQKRLQVLPERFEAGEFEAEQSAPGHVRGVRKSKHPRTAPVHVAEYSLSADGEISEEASRVSYPLQSDRLTKADRVPSGISKSANAPVPVAVAK